MEQDNRKSFKQMSDGFFQKHPIISNSLIIIIVAVLGIIIVYLGLALFTNHGAADKVPGVENMSYTEAISKLHDSGFRIEIRDSLYRDDVKPGYVIEQFPKANSIVKPGRKIFLYINAVHPKEVIIDDDSNPGNALRGYPERQVIARLEELGFKNIRIVKVLGESDRIVKITANGQIVLKKQKVPVNARLVVEVSDGRLQTLRDSLSEAEMVRNLSASTEEKEELGEIPEEIPVENPIMD